ncbi:O-methyltransferase bik3 [Lachnellula cervina]|uniref:O-methyltransferase bik3 n=1 Tax=Lachnellula cervina TaxID=1316786 RepID=A0A7D8UMH2_9HELO|nr:O-methyltransferase bik3 [Lachnellula cervina]
MAAVNASPLMSHKHLASNFPWETLSNGIVVDLGGSRGELCAALALAAPSLHFIIQELPRTVQSVDRATLPLTLLHESSSGAQLFHSAARRCSRVYLSADLPQLGRRNRGQDPTQSNPGATTRGTEPGKSPLMQERQIRQVRECACGKKPTTLLSDEYRAMDMLMLSICNARERDEEDWRQVFTEADSRFKVPRVFTPKGAALGIVDVVWEGLTTGNKNG